VYVCYTRLGYGLRHFVYVCFTRLGNGMRPRIQGLSAKALNVCLVH
jgi:hypothetical protein